MKRPEKRILVPGQTFYFFAGGETGETPPDHYNPADYVELNGGGYIIIHDAECYSPEFDRQKNFFFTKGEARKALSKIRKIIKEAR
jgi:hypothetical protein